MSYYQLQAMAVSLNVLSAPPTVTDEEFREGMDMMRAQLAHDPSVRF